MSAAERPNQAGMHCDRAGELLPRYLDGELSEGQAQAMRQHLLACAGCRAEASRGRALERWFEPLPPPVAPEGFAARVAAAASRLEHGHLEHGRLEHGRLEHGREIPDTQVPGVASRAPREVPIADLRQFVLTLTAVAAAALFALSIVLGLRERPTGDELRAEPLSDVLLELEALNADQGPRAGADRSQPDGGR